MEKSNRMNFAYGSRYYTILLNMVFVLYAFLLPLSKAFPVFTGPYIILLFWLLEGGFSLKFEKIKSSKAMQFLLLFFFFSILSLLWSDNVAEGRQLLRYYFAIVVVAVSLYTSMQEKFVKYILYAFLLSMFISEITSYGIYFGWWQMQGHTAADPTPFMHHTIYSVFLAVTIFLLISQVKDIRTPLFLRVFELLFLLSSSVNLFINGGRTGQLALIFGALAYTFIYFKKKIYLLYTLLVLAAVFMSAYSLSTNFNHRVHQAVSDIQNIQKGNLQTSWGTRIAIKIVSSEIIEDNILFGVGMGDSMDVYKEYLQKPKFSDFKFTKNVHHLHDQFIQILVQTGIIGFGLFLFFFYALFRIIFTSTNDLIKASLFSILTVFIFSFFTDVPFKNFTAGLFAFVIGYFLNRTAVKNV